MGHPRAGKKNNKGGSRKSKPKVTGAVAKQQKRKPASLGKGLLKRSQGSTLVDFTSSTKAHRPPQTQPRRRRQTVPAATPSPAPSRNTNANTPPGFQLAPATFQGATNPDQLVKDSQKSVFANDMLGSLEESSAERLEKERENELRRIEYGKRFGRSKIREKRNYGANRFDLLNDADEESGEQQAQPATCFFQPATYEKNETLVAEKESEQKYNSHIAPFALAAPSFRAEGQPLDDDDL